MANDSTDLASLQAKLLKMEEYFNKTEKWKAYTEQNMNDFFLITMSIVIFRE